jgi:hypothetical protein
MHRAWLRLQTVSTLARRRLVSSYIACADQRGRIVEEVATNAVLAIITNVAMPAD